MQYLRQIIMLLFAATTLLSLRLPKPINMTTYSSASIAEENTPSAIAKPSPNNVPAEAYSDTQDFAEISLFLQQIPTGRRTLDLVEKYHISVRFVGGGGSYYNSNDNQVIIDSNHESFRKALSLVHEVTHARFHHEGLEANILIDDRQSYIEKKVSEEVEAVANSIAAKMELEDAGIDVSKIWYTLEYPYRQAYEAAVVDAKANISDISDETLKIMGREAGRQVILEKTLAGRTWTSVSKETYTEFYGKNWDAVNAYSS